MVETTINIPFAVKLETDSNYFGYVDDNRIRALMIGTYGRASKAKTELRSRIEEHIADGLERVKNYQTRAIGTAEGSVFIVRFATGGWQYSIVGPGRTHGGSCHGSQSFDETLADAKRHAESTFGGIVWECSL